MNWVSFDSIDELVRQEETKKRVLNQKENIVKRMKIMEHLISQAKNPYCSECVCEDVAELKRLENEYH